MCFILPLLSVDAAEGDLGLRQLPCPLSNVELLAARLAGVCESNNWLLEILDGRLGGRRPVWSSWFELCVDAILDSFSLGVGDRKSSADFVRDYNKITISVNFCVFTFSFFFGGGGGGGGGGANNYVISLFHDFCFHGRGGG